MKKWAILFALLQAGDALTTVYATRFLNFEEINPLMAVVLDASPYAFLGLKALGTALILAIAFRYRVDPSARTTLKVGTAFMALVVAWNIGGILHNVA